MGQINEHSDSDSDLEVFIVILANVIIGLRTPAVTRRDVPTSQSMDVGVTDALRMCGWSI